MNEDDSGRFSLDSRARALVEAMPDGVVVRDPDGVIREVNDVFCRITGFDRADLVGRSPPLPFWPRAPGVVDPLVALRTRGVSESETTLQRADGSPLRARVAVAPLRESDGRASAYVETVREMTRAVPADSALRRAEERHRTIVETLATAEQDLLTERDRAARRTAVQTALRRIAEAIAAERPLAEVFVMAVEAIAGVLGVGSAAVVRLEPQQAIVLASHGLGPGYAPGAELLLTRSSPHDQARRGGRAVRVARSDHLPPEHPARLLLEAESIRSLVVIPLLVRGVTWGTIDVARRSRPLPPDIEGQLEDFARVLVTAVTQADARAELLLRASTDPLTGLANHRVFYERLDAECERARRHGRELTLAILDLDLFKQVNDTLGHQAGDRVIAEVGARIAGLARPGDLMGRIGGDEFGWILPETHGLGGYAAAERARKELSAHPFADVGAVSSSAGVCDLLQAETAAELFRRADAALYWAKAQGRGATYLYSSDVVQELSAAARARRLARTQALGGLRALARAIDAKDPSTQRHSERVADLAARLARALGWSDERSARLHEAALLHDVGKIGVPDAILFKPGRLSPEEYEQVKRHAALSAEIAREVLDDEQSAWLCGHHERYDGSGYPDALSGAQIPDGARLLAPADAWDVMTNVRSYRTAISPEEGLAELRRCAGTQFSPEAIDAFEGVVRALPVTA